MSFSTIINLSENVYNPLSASCSKKLDGLLFPTQVRKRYRIFFDIIVVLTLKEC